MSFIHSIKFRFTIWYLLVLTVLLLALSAGVYAYLSRSLYQNMDDSLRLRSTQLQNVRGVIDSIVQGDFQEDLGEVVLFYATRGEENITVSPRELTIGLDADIIEGALDGDSGFTSVEAEGMGELRFYVVPFGQNDPAILPRNMGMMPAMRYDSAAVAVGRSTQGIEDTLARLRRILIVAIPLTLVIAGAGGLFLARRALKPVDEISRTALEIEEKDLSQRIPVNTRDELGRLSSVLNQMIDRLEKAFQRQQQFTGDASHELRAPLAVIEAESTLALQKKRTIEEYQQSLGLVAQEAGHMSVIIDQLLAMARADAGREMVLEEIDLGEILKGVAGDAEVLCREKGLVFEPGAMGHDVMVKGDTGRLKVLFLSLLDNAIRYTPAGGTVSLSLSVQGRFAVATVRDTGMGIPPEEIPHIFDRFYRVDKARSRAEGGSGLGLAICRQIAEAHGGEIEVESQPEEGSAFSVRLPLI